MSLPVGPRPAVEVPELTTRMARASNPGGTTTMWVRDRLGGLWKDEDFADCYSRNGRPGLSPAQLATVSVPQFLLGLSDRDAARPCAAASTSPTRSAWSPTILASTTACSATCATACCGPEGGPPPRCRPVPSEGVSPSTPKTRGPLIE